MMDLFVQFLIWWMVFEVVAFVVRWYLNYKELKNLEHQVSEVMSDIRENCIVVNTETVGNVYLMYDQVTGNFVCQGNSEREMWQNARQRFPNKEFMIKKMQGDIPTFEFVR